MGWKVLSGNDNIHNDLGTHLFVKVSQLGDSKVTFSVFESSCYLLLPVWPLKGGGNLVKCLAQGHNKRTCQPISTITLLNAERQAGKLWIPTFKLSFGLTRPENQTLVYRPRGERSNQWHKTKWYKTLEIRSFFIGMVTLHYTSSLTTNFMAQIHQFCIKLIRKWLFWLTI